MAETPALQMKKLCSLLKYTLWELQKLNVSDADKNWFYPILNTRSQAKLLWKKDKPTAKQVFLSEFRQVQKL